jgi:hypothetical protein
MRKIRLLGRLLLCSILPRNSVGWNRIRLFRALVAGIMSLGLSAALLPGVCLCAQALPKSPTQANKLGPTTSPVLEQRSEPAQQSSPGQSHGDVWIIGADFGVAIGTLLLVLVTRVHVKHFKRLVERIERIYELQSGCRIATSLIGDRNSHAQIWIQNIGQVPVTIAELRFKILDHRDKHTTLPTEVSEVKYSWMLPGEKRMIQDASLDGLWSAGRAESVTIECSYFDAYPERGKTHVMKKLITVWELDHGRKSISLLTEN